MVTDSLQNELVDRLWHAVAPDIECPDFVIDGPVTLDSTYAVSEFAAASVAVAGMAVTLLSSDESRDAAAAVVVDRPLASAWFDRAVTLPHTPSPWDPMAGDYAGADGWIRLHTNAPHHKAAALRVLGVIGASKSATDRDSVAAAVAEWNVRELESAIVDAGGCAAAMLSWSEWMRHPQGVAVQNEPLVVWREGSAAGSASSGFRVIAGPVATRFLAGFGADVLRIDPPEWNEPGLEADMTLGKRTARLDARSADGLGRLKELIAEADVVVHGYRADALERLGLGDLDALRPGIVEVGIDAYGWSGPWRNRRGFDSLVQFSSGIADEGMRWYGTVVPKSLPVQALDHATGYLAAAAALVGLARLRDTGVGSSARLSLARTALELTGVGRGETAVEAPLQIGSHIETPWGSAQLMPPPLTVDGEPPRWERMPRGLGADAPAF